MNVNANICTNLSANLKQLREARGQTQSKLSKISGVPRPTIANLESGESNPTLSVLVKIASALHVSVESLISPPRSTTKRYYSSQLPRRERSGVLIRQVLPDSFGGLDVERMELPVNTRMIGQPHKTGTREYLTCESGEIELSVAGEKWKLLPGDVVVFRGDQKHSYVNISSKIAVGYSMILVGPVLV